MVSFVLGIISTKIVSVSFRNSGMASLGSFRNFAGMIKSVATLGINNSFKVTLRIKRIRMN
jgi:PST family polysaccharide transporter